MKRVIALLLGCNIALAAQVSIPDLSKQKSVIKFVANGTSGIVIRGEASGKVVTGDLTISEKGKPSGKQSMKVAELNTGLPTRDKHMREYLESEKFPEVAMKLDASACNDMGIAPPGANWCGKISLHGFTLPVGGRYEVRGKGALFTFKIHLPEFGIQTPKFAGITVADWVDVEVSLSGE